MAVLTEPRCTCDPAKLANICRDIRKEPHLAGCPRWGTPLPAARARVYRNDLCAWQWEVWDADGRGVSWGAVPTWAEAMSDVQRWLTLAPTWWR